MRTEGNHPQLPGIDRGAPCTVWIDGRPLTAYPGETIATVLLANGRFLTSPAYAGFFCGMGVCYGCVVWVDSRPKRACVTPILPEMHVNTGVEKRAKGES